MAADIDEFIRNQKIRMARDREKLDVNNDIESSVRPKDHVGAILREDEPHPQDNDMSGPTNEERKAAIDGRYGGSSMPGIGERAGDGSRHAVTDRNRDYNAFKAVEEAKFRNRFANRKPVGRQPSLVGPPPGMVPPQLPPPSVLQQQQHQQQQQQSGPQYPSPHQHRPQQQQQERGPQYPSPHQNRSQQRQHLHRSPQQQQQQQRGANPDSFGRYEPSALGTGQTRSEYEYNKKLDSLAQTVADLREQVTRQGQRPPPPEPRPGWATPDYADLLEAKRKQEARRRRLEDPELFAEKSEKERRLEHNPGDPRWENHQELDFEHNSQKTSLMTTRRSGPRRMTLDLDNSEDWLRAEAKPDLERKMAKLEAQPSAPRPQQAVRQTGPGRTKEAPQMLGLPVGQEERISAKNRRQGAYRQELQQQMREQQEMKRREKADRLAPVPDTTRRQPNAPASQISQPPPVVTQAGVENLSSLTAYNTPADDAYFYYASRDPLDIGGSEDVVGPNTSNVLHQLGPPPAAASKPAPAAGNSVAANRARMQGSTAVGLPTGDDKEAERRRKAEYARELQRQMQEVAATKERRRKEQEEYDRKKDEEIANYNPFQSRGGGGGEPIKHDGEVVTDLRAHKRQGGATPRAPDGPNLKLQLSESFATPQQPASVPGTQRTPRPQVNAHGETTHARGGHGVFGQPKSDEEKQKIDLYKEELRKQMEENQRKKEEQKRREKLEEEKEQKRAEEQLKRIKAEYDEEQRKKQEKIEATKRKNEEIWREAEEKRKREIDARKAKFDATTSRQSNLPKKPPPSPPIPSIARHQRTQSPQRLGSSGAPRLPAPARKDSQPDVLLQLERMKKELQSERLKVEDALKAPPPAPVPTQRYEVVPPSAKGGRRSRNSDLDVFEMALEGRSGPVVVRSQRPRGDPPSEEVLREFRRLKLRESEVGRNVRDEHPGTPLTGDQLEVQQNTYLRHQQQYMHDMTHRPIEPVRYQSPCTPPRPVPTPRAHSRVEKDLEVASQYSFDVEGLNDRTEERMRRLSRMNADQISMQDQDEVLDRFMRQRTHVTNEAERDRLRPPSVQNRQTSYDAPPLATKGTAMVPPVTNNRDTYHTPSGYYNDSRADSNAHNALAGINVNTRDGWEDESPAPGGPTPLDDSWLNPTRRR